MDQGASNDVDQGVTKNTLSGDKKVILIVGRTGNGKKSVGNSILGESPTVSKSEEDTMKPLVRDKDDTRVIICPFIGDTGDDIGYTIDQIRIATLDMMNTHVAHHGIVAVVLVLKYGVRFTKQEKDAVKRVKEIFGENIFLNFGIIAFSYGDLFDLDNPTRSFQFSDWCLQQMGDVKALFDDTRNRIVLFNNRAKSEEVLLKQQNSFWKLFGSNCSLTKTDSHDSLCSGYAFPDASDAEIGEDATKIVSMNTTSKIRSSHTNITNDVFYEEGHQDRNAFHLIEGRYTIFDFTKFYIESSNKVGTKRDGTKTSQSLYSWNIGGYRFSISRKNSE